MARPEKAEKIEKLAALMDSSVAALLVEYRGLKVGELVVFRREIRKAGGELRVVKNTLFRRALTGTPAEALCKHVLGPVGVIFCAEDVGGPAKAALEYAEKNPVLKVGPAWADGQLYDANQVIVRSKLPGRQELIGQLACVLNAPIAGLATSLNGIIARLARALDQVAEKAA